MNFFAKLRPDQFPAAPQRNSPPGGARQATAVAVAKTATPAAPPVLPQTTSRQSNGLKEFLWLLDGIGHGHLLDLGPARQSTLNFFIERGFKVYTEDFLETWRIFLEEDRQREKRLATEADPSELTPEARAQRFLGTTLLYPDDSFDAVLMWDILDYLDYDLMTRLAARITSLLRGGGVVFAMFHQKKPQTFHRYRVLDAQNLELLPASCPFLPQRVFQNREISNLFYPYRHTKMFVGRDQLRESLFVK